jgi:hypothetical protein
MVPVTVLIHMRLESYLRIRHFLLGHNNQAFDNTIGKLEIVIRNVCQQQSCHHLTTIYLHIHF